MIYQVAVRLGASSSAEAGQGNPKERKGPETKQQSQRQALLPLLGVPQED